ncbi:hypothetical protein M8C21_003453, partial [Ambrosia artemisiifolia]
RAFLDAGRKQKHKAPEEDDFSDLDLGAFGLASPLTKKARSEDNVADAEQVMLSNLVRKGDGGVATGNATKRTTTPPSFAHAGGSGMRELKALARNVVLAVAAPGSSFDGGAFTTEVDTPLDPPNAESRIGIRLRVVGLQTLLDGISGISPAYGPYEEHVTAWANAISTTSVIVREWIGLQESKMELAMERQQFEKMRKEFEKEKAAGIVDVKVAADKEVQARKAEWQKAREALQLEAETQLQIAEEGRLALEGERAKVR